MTITPFPQRKILFVSNGGICRAPMAAGILHGLIREQGRAHTIAITTAAISGIHVGKTADSLAIEASATRGCDIRDFRVHRVEPQDLLATEVLATDKIVLAALRNLAPHGLGDRPQLLTRYSGMGLVDIVDPYGGTVADYRSELDLIEASCKGLAAALLRRR
ncbi:hypothetical protein [Reyranella sp.]|jgi:protein-tyrosine phosphatase|uniref:arsenate reductase/protein-tyrosine-phosphatase family protein n=1 Tax=Reyranella sp. TaxID=1929291 RepID=UPI000BDD2B9B|nr:hypothetical protein [Reyranella sp.]OYY33920.1 MAG: hypothetical protein B7Y57_28570 [Rhodospirillales bacterium 35-66-84]OYZ90692.1 MAG: hypothetical protein B7Y08_28950 [Rhodospirillales bacterium 24-66-33]OZB21012.1 MAG: hypothetical protein B7X63_28855 [Rhodospirillales bacterium 39-66-50]HQS19207.1 hypothetical protein [Reyranella sp.]HQT15478.1 hypothetical protein [Reyranella sp.]